MTKICFIIASVLVATVVLVGSAPPGTHSNRGTLGTSVRGNNGNNGASPKATAINVKKGGQFSAGNLKDTISQAMLWGAGYSLGSKILGEAQDIIVDNPNHGDTRYYPEPHKNRALDELIQQSKATAPSLSFQYSKDDKSLSMEATGIVVVSVLCVLVLMACSSSGNPLEDLQIP